MATHLAHIDKSCFYFVTFTNHKWLPLIEESNSYEYVRNSFVHLASSGCEVCAYVIMPNHIHLLLYVNDTCKSLNKAMSNYKRFMAYEIVRNLKLYAKVGWLDLMREGVQINECANGKKHQVFRLSFDASVVKDHESINRVLDYIHRNPVSGKWMLCDDYVKYPYSSAAHYELGQKDLYIIKDYKELID